MITRDELIAIGHYNKTHGVAGEISATIDVDMSLLESLSCLVSDLDGIFVPFFVNSCRPKTNETVLLTIDGIENEQEASRLVNHEIFALKKKFRHEAEDVDADGYPLDYFIGFTLLDNDGTRVGEIIEVDEQTENAIFIVEREGQEIMVPATDELIVEFDLDKKEMVMDLPQGILDLND
ncbi:MAG: 16S rRNA processing protein RimM [Muribaculaceae bacterium]|nr:16S rRNA processing protein RimM [Muribaculaceae bacterium]